MSRHDVKCPECDGMGEWDEGPLPARSSVQIDPEYRQVKCDRCNGTGRRVVHTNHDYPPIPIRSCDWSAVFDDYDGAPDSHCPHGTGPTEEAAIADLLEQEAERAEEAEDG